VAFCYCHVLVSGDDEYVDAAGVWCQFVQQAINH
jgi:hypothetical protein